MSLSRCGIPGYFVGSLETMETAIDLARWDVPALAERWRRARPFPHLVIDGALPEALHAALCQGLQREPLQQAEDEIFRFRAGQLPPADDTVREVVKAFAAAPVFAAVEAFTGQLGLSGLELSAYLYDRGSYLLPHSDFRPELGRAVAIAYYAELRGEVRGGAVRGGRVRGGPVRGGTVRGGELELFECALQGGEIVRARPALRIPPRENRLVLFEVGLHALHQVREVLAGERLSLAGWFLR